MSAPPARWRRTLIQATWRRAPLPASRQSVMFAAAVAVVAAVLAAGGYLLYGASSGGPSPGAVVASYLQALGRGDARAALALAATVPPDRSRLTDNVLAEQQRLAPISAVTVLDTSSSDYGAVTRVMYRVGAERVEERINLVRHGSSWALANGAVNVEVSAPESLPNPVALGVPISGDGDIWVFPGIVTFGSADDVFAASPGTALYTSPDTPAMASLHAVLSSGGESAARTAVRAALERCMSARSLAPSGCPQQLPGAATPGRIPGTERWQGLSGFDALSFAVDRRTPTLVHATGSLTFRLTYQVGAGKHRTTRTAAMSALISASIDFSAQPATATLR